MASSPGVCVAFPLVRLPDKELRYHTLNHPLLPARPAIGARHHEAFRLLMVGRYRVGCASIDLLY